MSSNNIVRAACGRTGRQTADYLSSLAVAAFSPPRADPPHDSHDQVENVRAALVAANILSLGGETEWETRPPGIDPRRVDIPDLRCKCVIQTVDYSSEVRRTLLLNTRIILSGASKDMRSSRLFWAKY